MITRIPVAVAVAVAVASPLASASARQCTVCRRLGTAAAVPSGDRDRVTLKRRGSARRSSDLNGGSSGQPELGVHPRPSGRHVSTPADAANLSSAPKIESKPASTTSGTESVASALAASKPSPATTVNDNADSYVTLLPPPPHLLPLTAAPSINQLRQSSQRFQIPKTLKHFSRLVALQALNLLTPADHALLGKFLETVIPTLDLSRYARQEPEAFGTLREMALHLAVCELVPDSGQGLQSFLDGLLKASEPQKVISAFEQFKYRLRKHQAKPVEALYSRIREVRVGARLDHSALIPLMTDYIAAHTMLDTFDGQTMLSLLDTNANFRTPYAFPLRRMRAIFGYHPRGPLKRIHERIKENCAKLCLAVLCYHPAALVNRIVGMVDARDWHGIEKLYADVLGASIGKNRWLVPLDLEGRDDMRFDCIPLTTRVWATFMVAFRTSGQLQLIDQMLDTDMPARGLTPSAWNVSLAMLSFAIAGSPQYLARADELWERILASGYTRYDIAIARRMDVLDLMRREHDWEELYRACLAGHMSGAGRHTAATYLKLLLLKRRRVDALRVLKDMLQGGSKALCKPDHHTYYTILRHVIRGPYTPEEKLETATALNEFNAAYNSASWAIVLSLALENGQPFMESTHKLIELMHVRAPPEHGMLTIAAWDQFLSALLRGTNGKPTAQELRAGLEALHEFARRGATAKTSKTVLNLHQLLLVNVARSNSLNADERHHALVSALALLKRQEPDPHRRVYAAILRVCLERNDDDGYDEALYWWALLKERSDVADSAWTTMLQGLIAADRTSAARALVADARTAVGKSGNDPRRFWDLAVAVEEHRDIVVGYDEVLDDVQDEAVRPVLEWKGVEGDGLEDEWEDQE